VNHWCLASKETLKAEMSSAEHLPSITSFHTKTIKNLTLMNVIICRLFTVVSRITPH
jgi:hypothetical protein